MVAETRTHLLVVRYDENQKTIPETFGSSVKEVDAILDAFSIDGEAEHITYTEEMMKLINQGKISGGALLTLAVQSIITISQVREIQSGLRNLLNLKEERNDENDYL